MALAPVAYHLDEVVVKLLAVLGFPVVIPLIDRDNDPCMNETSFVSEPVICVPLKMSLLVTLYHIGNVMSKCSANFA